MGGGVGGMAKDARFKKYILEIKIDTVDGQQLKQPDSK